MADIKLQPQNIDAEKAIIGAILIDRDSIVKIADVLAPEYFYDEKNRILYEVMLELYENRDPIDIVTVTNKLKKREILEKVGGSSFVTQLANETPSAYNVEAHAKIVRDSYIRRKLIQISGEFGDLAYDEQREIEDLLDEAEQRLFNISSQSLKGEFVSIRKSLEESFDLLDELYRNKDKLRGVPTGFKNLDSKLNGFRPGNLIIVAARPSVGKTSLLLNISQYAAVEHKVPVGIFSLEMSNVDLVNRMVSAQANIDGFRIVTGKLTDDEMAAFGEASGVLADAPLYIDDSPSVSIMELRTKARRIHADKGVKMIVVDYLQLMRGRNTESRVQEVSEISWGLKALAKELNIPVVAAAQLNRSVEQRGTKQPQLSDLRESGSIEQDADVVMFLHRPDDENKNEVILSIAKHRNGPIGTVPMFYRGERTKFYEQTTTKEKEGE